MGSQDSKIRFVIEAKDNATLQIREISNGLQWLETRYTKAAVAFTAASATISVAFAAASRAMQLVDMGARAEQAVAAFDSVATAAGESAERIAEGMMRASGETANASDVMQRAVKGMNLGLAGDQIISLMEAARVSARVTGASVPETFDRIVDAVASNMPRALRQMGLVTKEQMEVFDKAVASGVTEVHLLDVVLANASIQQARFGDVTTNAFERIQTFRSQVNDLQETIGSGLIWVLQKAFAGFQWLASGILAATAAAPKFMEQVSRLSAYVQDKIGNADRAAVARADAAQMARLYDDLMGASEELAGKAAANWGVQGVGPGTGPDAGQVKTAQASLARLMDDLKKRLAAAKGGSEIEKLKEEWGRIERELTADADKLGLDEFSKKIIDIDKRVEDLKAKAARLPGADRTAAEGSVDAWAVAMRAQAKAEAEAGKSSASRETFLKAAAAAADAERDLTDAVRTEAQRRIDAVTVAADKQRQAYLEAYDAQVLDAEEYKRRIAATDQSEAAQRGRIQAETAKAVREAEISGRLAALDLLEAEGAAARTTLAERIRLTDELAASQRSYLSGLDKAADPTAWYAQAQALDATRKSLAQLRRELDMTSPARAAVRALEDLSNVWTDTGRQMYDVARSTAEAMQGAFSDFFFDAITGKMKSMGDYLTSFLNSVARSISAVMGQQLAAGVVGLGKMALGFHGGGVVGETSPSFYRIVPGAVFDQARRYHSGLMSDEFPAILQKGEMVLSRRDVSRLSDSAGAGAAPAVEVNIINQSGTPLSGSQQGSPRFDGKKWVLDIVVEGLDRYAPLRTAIGNTRS